jgi:tryptophan 2,3-dioxygenase
MAANPFDGPYGTGTTEYERYLRTFDLLGLQKPPELRTHPDELFFQTVHQVEELWMKLMVHELGELVVQLGAGRVLDGLRAMARVNGCAELLGRQLELFRTMAPTAYLAIRAGLGQGSGMDSPGFVRLNELAPAVWAAYEAALARAGTDVLAVYAEPSPHADLFELGEALVSFDAGMQRFKREHILVVRRIIGIGTASLRGNPMELLERSAQLTYFPMLWAVRERLFADFKAGPRI